MSKSKRSRSGSRASYRRSTPVIRLRRNVEKIHVNAALVCSRLRDWQVGKNKLVVQAHDLTDQIVNLVAELSDRVEQLDKSGFVPPRKSGNYQPEVGDRVRVVKSARSRYEQLYEQQVVSDPEMLDDLVVAKVLPSGEVAVRRGRRAPIVARKTHLCPIKD